MIIVLNLEFWTGLKSRLKAACTHTFQPLLEAETIFWLLWKGNRPTPNMSRLPTCIKHILYKLISHIFKGTLRSTNSNTIASQNLTYQLVNKLHLFPVSTRWMWLLNSMFFPAQLNSLNCFNQEQNVQEMPFFLLSYVWIALQSLHFT